MPVGAFPGLDNPNRRTIRGPVNPLDKTSIVSIYPKQITEVNATIFPGRFTIEAGSYEKPSILLVTPSSWWREIDAEQPLLEIPVSSIQVADSVVNDYSKGLLACDMAESRPGLFIIPGEITSANVIKDYKSKLDLAKSRQENFFKTLVKLADVLWARTNGNPLSISDDMRLACNLLNIKDKPWLQNFESIQLTNCPACGFLRNDLFPICSNCKAILNKEQFAKLGLQMSA